MAVSYKKAGNDMDNVHEEKTLKVSLKDEIKNARNAKKAKLDLEDMKSNVSDKPIEQQLNKYIDEQKVMIEKLSKAIKDLDETKKYLIDESRTAEQMALNGVDKAQQQAQKITMKNLQATQDKCVSYVQVLVEQAQKRTERLRKSTHENRFIPITTWLISLLNLMLLIYILLT
ncbi:hypothetical protein AT54_01102 [Streptococcus equi subsp. zooepidemicus Sz12is]|uniref:hypothetical protein n=1 Tax=Streptococcus equi TaxID=1336 RepID=UPI0005B8152A|nr:hypothetical protein [Streptococcus equi]KIS05194.1 hypothetical protein AT54_01102 [Streptococcus equi subsp. zooepidemicus Sz12is]